ncbi:hypothetical protein ACOMHN_053020 [Nucella lapillus]
MLNNQVDQIHGDNALDMNRLMSRMERTTARKKVRKGKGFVSFEADPTEDSDGALDADTALVKACSEAELRQKIAGLEIHFSNTGRENLFPPESAAGAKPTNHSRRSSRPSGPKFETENPQCETPQCESPQCESLQCESPQCKNRQCKNQQCKNRQCESPQCENRQCEAVLKKDDVGLAVQRKNLSGKEGDSGTWLIKGVAKSPGNVTVNHTYPSKMQCCDLISAFSRLQEKIGPGILADLDASACGSQQDATDTFKSGFWHGAAGMLKWCVNRANNNPGQASVHSGASDWPVHSGASDWPVHSGASDWPVHSGASDWPVDPVQAMLKSFNMASVHSGASDWPVDPVQAMLKSFSMTSNPTQCGTHLSGQQQLCRTVQRDGCRERSASHTPESCDNQSPCSPPRSCNSPDENVLPQNRPPLLPDPVCVRSKVPPPCGNTVASNPQPVQGSGSAAGAYLGNNQDLNTASTTTPSPSPPAERGGEEVGWRQVTGVGAAGGRPSPGTGRGGPLMAILKACMSREGRWCSFTP